MGNPIGAEAVKLAGLQIDFLQKLRSGQLTVEQWEMFNNLSSEERSDRFGDRKKQVMCSPSPSRLTLLFETTDTDLDLQLKETETFAWTVLGVTVDLRETFVIPTEIPWKKVFAIFDPGLTNREMVGKALEGQGVDVYEEVDVANYYGAQSLGRQTLCLIAGTIPPDEETMGLSPNHLLATGKPYLSLRNYGLAQAKQKFSKQAILDLETYTWFPENSLADGRVAVGRCGSRSRQIRFRWNYPGRRYPISGARVAISCPLAVS